MRQTKKNNRGITAISVQGFKSLANESRIEIRPFTILAGANSSGKSSIMQPLLLMKQTLQAVYDPGHLLLHGPNAKFTSADQFISRMQKGSDCQRFSVEIEMFDNEMLKLMFSVAKNQRLEIREMIITEGDNSLPIKPDQILDDLENPILRSRLGARKWPAEPLISTVRNRCFLDVDFSAKNVVAIYYEVHETGGFSEPYVKNLCSMIHVPGLRGNPDRVYTKTVAGPDFSGTFEHYVATIIADWEQKGDRRLKRLEAMLIDLGLTWKISTKTTNYTQIELWVGRLPKLKQGGDDLVSIADVGFGVSQVLPVLVALLVAAPGQLVYLDQPELHLHPRAQYALAKILADAAKRGVKLVVETHSALFLLQVQTLVAKGDLDPDLVKLHWFSIGENGTTSIQSADLDKNGAFGNWPEDFGDIELKAESAYLDAVEDRGE